MAITPQDGMLPDLPSDIYTVEREIGRGGMATVYAARDTKHGRRVALKVLRVELGVSVGTERFRREISLAAGLQHPHIVPVHDSGETASGTLWFTMPLIEGRSLRELLRQDHQLPVDEAVRITREVALALDYAHRHGVIHRDIKPERPIPAHLLSRPSKRLVFFLLSGLTPRSTLFVQRIPLAASHCHGKPVRTAFRGSTSTSSATDAQLPPRAEGLFRLRVAKWHNATLPAPDPKHRSAIPLYPSDLLSGGFEGTLTFAFVIDEDGAVVPSTLVIQHVTVGHVGLPYHAADGDWVHFNAFVDAVLPSIRTARYRPATIDGCLIKSLAEQPFTFGIRH